MLCAVNGNKQRLRIMRRSIKSYYITQVGYASTRLLCINMYMYTYIYIYGRRRISCFGNSLRSSAVKREICGVVTKESLHADVDLWWMIASKKNKSHPNCTILMSNDSSSSSHLLIGKVRQSGNERRGDRTGILGKLIDTPCSWGSRVVTTRREIVSQQRLFVENKLHTEGLTLGQSRGESTHLVLRAQLQKLIRSVLRLISISY